MNDLPENTPTPATPENLNEVGTPAEPTAQIPSAPTPPPAPAKPAPRPQSVAAPSQPVAPAPTPATAPTPAPSPVASKPVASKPVASDPFAPLPKKEKPLLLVIDAIAAGIAIAFTVLLLLDVLPFLS